MEFLKEFIKQENIELLKEFFKNKEKCEQVENEYAKELIKRIKENNEFLYIHEKKKGGI